MSAGEIHLNDIGTAFEMTVKDDDGVVVNLASATTLTFTFDKPDGTNITKTPTFVTDGSDGRLRYVAQSGDLDQIGLWRWQGTIVIPAGTFHSDIYEFRVYPNL